jgi:hypothetical protein
MEIVIVRQDHKPWGIDGHLYINRKRICDTVEHPTKHLPSGEYIMDSFSSTDTTITPPFREGMGVGFLFRHGDGAMALKQREVIVGKQLLPGVVTQSQATYDRLYERLKKAFQRGTTVRLSIRG